MKLLTILYDSSIDQSLMAIVEELEIKGWTKIPGLPGLGIAGLKINSPVWPGINNMLLVGAEEGTARALADSIHQLQDEFKLRPGIFMYLQDVEEV